jgi:hypothetical protein
MPDVKLRKMVSGVEEILHEGGPTLDTPIKRAFAVAIIENPFAGRFAPDIEGFMDDLKPLGLELSQRLLSLLGGDPAAVESYGKGAIVGAEGESEHGALWHVPGGYAMRELLGGAKAIVPSAMKLGGVGASLDVPLGHREAAYVRTHFDAITVCVPDAPRARELAYALAMTTGGRPHPRVGGLTVDQVKGEDGLR